MIVQKIIFALCLFILPALTSAATVKPADSSQQPWLCQTCLIGGQVYNSGYQYIADFNGDGFDDYMWNWNGWYVALSNGVTFESPTLWLCQSCSPSGRVHQKGYQYLGDFNGDGLIDYMFNWGGWHVALSDGTKFTYPTPWLKNNLSNGTRTFNGGYQYVGDFNGDGRTDYMWNWGGWYVALSGIDRFTRKLKFIEPKKIWLENTDSNGARTYNLDYQYIADFNGDGLLDYMYNWDGWRVALSNGVTFESPTLWLCQSCSPSGRVHQKGYQYLGDFNGDGLIDYMYNWGGWHVALSDGTKFTYPTPWLENNLSNGARTFNGGYQYVGDFNGDGRTDYMWNWGGWYIALAGEDPDTREPKFLPPKEFWLSSTEKPSGRTYNRDYQFLGDFTGDGMPDFMWNWNGWWVASNHLN